MEDTISSVFLAGRDRYTRLRQFGLFVIAGAAAVHLSLFLGYTRTVHDADEAKRNLEKLAGAAEATTDVQESVAEFTASLDAKPVLERLLTSVRADFVDLNKWLDEARNERPPAAPAAAAEAKDPAAGPKSPNLAEQSPPSPPGESKDPNDVANAPNLAEQHPLNVSQDTAVRRSAAPKSPVRQRLDELSDEDRKRLVRRGPDFRAMLDPIIVESIVKARFAEANQAWQRQIRDEARPAADAVKVAAAALPDIGPRARQIEPTVAKALAEAEAIVFMPPPNDRWWRSVNEKMAAIAEIEHNAAERMVDGIRTTELTTGLDKDAERARQDAEALVADLEKTKKELDEQAKNALASLSTFAKPLEFVAVDVSTLVRWFPLVVGMALAIALWFGTEARRTYIEALDFVQSAAPEDAAWTRVVAHSRTSLVRGSTPWIPWLLAATLWIGAASWRLAYLQMSTVPRAVAIGAVGVALVAACVAHRVVSLKR